MKVTVTSDQEAAMIALKKALAVKRQAETVLCLFPVRDSRANGSVERVVKTWAAQTRTLRHHLEARLKVKVPKDSPLMTWLATLSAEAIFRYKIQGNGRTSYETVTGHKGSQPVDIFGEKLMSKYAMNKNRRDRDVLGRASRHQAWLDPASTCLSVMTTSHRYW